MRVTFLFAASLLALPAFAGGAAAAERSDRPSRGDRQVCRDLAPSMTRIRGPRVCMSQREWDRSRDTSQEALTDFQGRPDPNASRRMAPR
jgi:hypothetical protein